VKKLIGFFNDAGFPRLKESKEEKYASVASRAELK